MSQTVITAREGNVFRGVCQSFCVQGGGVGTPIGTDIKWWPPQRSARIVLECILVFFFQMVIVLNGYADSFKDKYTKILRKKMGIENSSGHNDVYLIGYFPHHPIPKAKFLPITALLNRSTDHKSAKGSPQPCP